MVKKTSVQKIVAMLCSALLNLTVVIPTAAEMVSLHVSFLENLGIDTMSVCLPSDTISIQQGRNMIFQLTGETVNVNSVQRPDVVEAFIRAMQYGYLLTDSSISTIYSAARQIGLMGTMILNDSGPMTCAELAELSVNALNTAVIQTSGYEDDPNLTLNPLKTIATERFGAKYVEGVVTGVYGDGQERLEPLWKNNVIIGGECYQLSGGNRYLGMKIRFAYVEADGEKKIIFIQDKFEITLEETEGHSGSAFFRRGIPFAEGELYNVEKFYLIDEEGQIPQLQKEVLETYWDGSIRWLSVSFVQNMQAHETRRLRLMIDEEAHERQADIAVPNKEGGYTLSNGALTVEITKKGVKMIQYRAENVIDEYGATLAIEEGGKKRFQVNSVELLRNGGVYAQVRLTGNFPGSSAEADWILYVYRGVNRLYQEAKFTAKGVTYFDGQTFEYDLTSAFSQFTAQTDIQQEDNKYEAEWVSFLGANARILMNSQDTVRFKGAVRLQGVNNGFVYDGGQHVAYAPIHTGVSYCWPDGIRRTGHLNMYFADPEEDIQQIADTEKAWSYMPPLLVLDSSRYVKAGFIEDDNKSEVILRQEETVSTLAGGKLWHTFEAGKIPQDYVVNYVTREMQPGTQTRSAGEIEFNLWKSFMNTGNPKLFSLIREDSEHWTDIMMYWGIHSELIGANRYKTGINWNDNRDFAMTHPFYGDMSGTYLTYMMTGDPMTEKAFRAGVDFWETDIRKNGLPVLSYWWTDKTEVHKDPDYQTRFMAQVRGMGIAYDLYKEKRFLDAVISTGKFVSLYQNEDGGFYEDYNRQTREPNRYMQPDGNLEPNEKYYIMLMGGRMMIEAYQAHPNEKGLNVSVRLADFLLSVMEEDGWLMQPSQNYTGISDKGCDGTATNMATYFFAEMYEVTGEEKYFDAMAKTFRFYVSQWNGGNVGRNMATSASSFLNSAQKVSRLMKENEDLAFRMGYADLVALLQNDTAVRTDLYPLHDTHSGRFSLNVYDTPLGRTLTFNHVSLSHALTYAQKSFDLDFCLDSQKSLWVGDENTVTAEGTFIKRPIEEVDLVHLLQTGLTLSHFDGDIRANINEYNRDKISFILSGEGAVMVSMKNSLFGVKEGDTFRISVKQPHSAVGVNVSGDEEVTLQAFNRETAELTSAGDEIFLQIPQLNGRSEIVIERKVAKP